MNQFACIQVTAVLPVACSVLFGSGCLAAVTPFAQREPLALRKATPNRTEVPQDGKFELALDLHATYDNPFDPEEVSAQALFSSPAGKTVPVDGFLYQGYTRRLENGAEALEPAGSPVWMIRFAPDAPGEWHYRVTAKDKSGTATLPE
jgi:hypothetical protein